MDATHHRRHRLEDIVERHRQHLLSRDWYVNPPWIADSASTTLDLALITLFRERELPSWSTLPVVPTDVFVWSSAPAIDRATTRVGGLPYW
ncbi:MAG: hypothetical protein KDA25_03775, partial [Phycisphaerales bacterium]|nr:hypothetical protein [Phycisphaerales bacterium]